MHTGPDKADYTTQAKAISVRLSGPDAGPEALETSRSNRGMKKHARVRSELELENSVP